MSEDRKLKVIEAIRMKGIDPINLEKELLILLRKEPSSVKVYDYIKKLLEGEKT